MSLDYNPSITAGSIINLVSLILTIATLIYKISRFTSTIERRIDRLELTLQNNTDNLNRIENATKLDVARLEGMNENCYVKKRVEDIDLTIDTIKTNQTKLRAELPHQLASIETQLTELRKEVQGMRSDIAIRRKNDK